LASQHSPVLHAADHDVVASERRLHSVHRSILGA
jgi:hypothetical protein